MGNCLNPSSKHLEIMMTKEEENRLWEMKRISHQVLQDQEEDDDTQELEEAQTEAATEGLKVKIVLTRAELEWLMAQLRTGERRLEDVLHQMHEVKGGTVAAAASRVHRRNVWRPGLQCILETTPATA